MMTFTIAVANRIVKLQGWLKISPLYLLITQSCHVTLDIINLILNFDYDLLQRTKKWSLSVFIIIASLLLMMPSPSEWSSFCGLQGKSSIPHPAVTSTINSATNHIRERWKWIWATQNSGDYRSSILHSTPQYIDHKTWCLWGELEWVYQSGKEG